jgi:hypothetical protein
VPVSDQVRPVESSKAAAASGFHSELHNIWGPPPALRQAGEFLSGVGEGFGQAVNEGAKAAAQAIKHPAEAIHKGVTETGKTIAGVLTATEAAGEYIGDHGQRGDFSGVLHDTQKTSHVIENVLTAGIEHLSKMSPHDLGKVVGHDVLPGAIVAVATPELAGESLALAASAASKMSTIAKEGAALDKAAGLYENAASKISAIAEKMAGLNSKLDNLLQQEKPIVHTAMEDTNGLRHKTGEIVQGLKPSKEFEEKVKAVQLSEGEKNFLQAYKIPVKPVHNIGAELGENYVFALGAYKDQENVIRIAEHTGFAKDLLPNSDIPHTVHHEIGHAVNYWLGNRTERPYHFVSDSEKFVDRFEKDLAKDTNAAKTAKARLEALYPDDAKAQRDEAFSMMFGHSSCPSNVGYAAEMREALVGCYKLISAYRRMIKI